MAANSNLNVVGRFLLASIFLASGLVKLQTYDYDHGTNEPVVRFVGPKLDIAAAKLQKYTNIQIPVSKDLYLKAIILATTMEIMGGFLFVFNHKFGAILLIAYLIPATLILHNFWDETPESEEQANQVVHFLKNVAVLGGLLSFIATTDGTPLKVKRAFLHPELQQAQ